jgi:hypothetical protein
VWKLDIDHETENRSRSFGASDSSEGRKLQKFGLSSTKFDTPRFAAGVSAQPRPQADFAAPIDLSDSRHRFVAFFPLTVLRSALL